MRKSQPFSLRLSPEVLREIRLLARRLERPASYVVSALIEESLRQRRCPGILFTDGPAGRRATVAGSGIDVWEVIRVFKACGEDLEALAQTYPHLSRRQLEAALHYYRRYPQEVDDRLAQEERAEAELAERLPLIKPYRV